MDDAFWDHLTDPRLFLLPITPLSQLSAQEPSVNIAAINGSIGPEQLPRAAPSQKYEIIGKMDPSLPEQMKADMHPGRQPFAYDESTALPVSKTTDWQWNAALAQRMPIGASTLPTPVSDTDLTPTELRVAVDANGTVQHVLLEESCQTPDLDQQAILAARKVRFQSAIQSGLEWGQLTIFWHYTSPPRDVVLPTPSTSPDEKEGE